MAQDEPNPDVLHSITIGFGHIGDKRCLTPLIRLRTHPNAEVRDGVAFALLGRPEAAALDTLITLSADEDAEVRDWATFGLARQTDEDFPGCATRSPTDSMTTTSTPASRPCTGWLPAVTNG